MIKTTEIGKKLEQISEEARAKLISKMPTDGLKRIPEKYVVEAIEFYEKKGRKPEDRKESFFDAATIAEHAGMYSRAIEDYLRYNPSHYVTALAKEHELVDETIDIYEKLIQETAATELEIDTDKYKWLKKLSRKPLPKKLTDILWSAGYFCCHYVDRQEKAVEFYERGEYFEPAAETAENAGMQEKAIEMWVKKDNLDAAARVAGKAGMTEKAIEFYLKNNNLYSAAGVAENAGMQEKARELYKSFLADFEKKKEKEHDVWFGAAARAAKKLGLEDRAKRYYERVIEYYEREGPLFMAAKTAEEAGMKERARELDTKSMKEYEEWGDFEEAAKTARKLGLEDKVKLYEELAELKRQ